MSENALRRDPTAEEIRAQLGRVLASDRFAKSRFLSRFLRFTVEHTLAGKAEDLKEYLIAIEVFGRKASFDPRADGIVRVQAVNLRSRIVAYYENEGAEDLIIIEYTKGNYVPTFRHRRDATSHTGTLPAPESLLVLPFVNMSPDPENEYFSDGLTEELISVLSNVHGLRVVARTSAFRYKGKAADVRQIGAELNARMVLEGSVRKHAGRLCITAQLVDAESGYQKWSRTYRVEMKDVFAVQQEIATAIASTIREHEGAAAPRRTANLAAYHNYLKGRFYLGKWTEEAFRKSAVFFQAAIELDPTFAAAYSGLADAQFVLACYGKVEGRELLAKAFEAASKAVEFDGMVAEAHVSLGAVRAIYEWNWQAAEREFLAAARLDPNCATAFQWYGVLCLIPQGRLEEAEAAIQHARDLDPLSPPINTSLGLVYFVEGRYDEAEAQFKRALEIEPDFDLAHWWLGAIYLNRDMLPYAFKSLRKAGLLSNSRFHDAAKFSAAGRRTPDRGKAQRILNALMSPPRREYVSPLLMAAVHASAGLKDGAIEWLSRAVNEHDPWVAWLGVDHRFDSLRDDPRFANILNEIGVGNARRTVSASAGLSG